MDVRVRRVYEQPSPDDGVRLLVDRLWPRGLSKDAEALARLAEAASRGTVTLLTATKDAEHSQAAVLAEQLAKGTGPDA